MASLNLREIRKELGGNPILRGIDLDVNDGELVVLVGPSGCGKSTLLRTIAGLELPDSGVVTIGDREVTKLPPRERDVAMVFQSYALYPHLSVRENLAFGLKLRGTDPEVIRQRVQEVSAMLGLESLLDRFPRQMSGGQRQRVAMGRAIARRPTLFLFDEPLSNLDAALRSDVRVEIKQLHANLGATMVYVTHDQVEAMTLADRLVVLRSGVVEQVGRPLDVYHHPVSRFVASFMGSPAMNFMDVQVENATLQGPDLHVTLGDRFSNLHSGQRVTLGFRPHDLVLCESDRAHLTMRIEVIEAMGFEAFAHGRVGETPIVTRLEGQQARTLHQGDAIGLRIQNDAWHLFDPESERALDQPPQP